LSVERYLKNRLSTYTPSPPHSTTIHNNLTNTTVKMPSNYIITEPAPSTTSYIRSGRGGAGNTIPISSLPSSATTAIKSTFTSANTSASTRRFFSGIGGAGNAHNANERPPISLDDEFRRAAAREMASAGHCGIGGAGNVYRRKASDASESAKSLDDDESVRSSMSSKAKLWARVSGTFSRD
jgi:hypothetical protein